MLKISLKIILLLSTILLVQPLQALSFEYIHKNINDSLKYDTLFNNYRWARGLAAQGPQFIREDRKIRDSVKIILQKNLDYLNDLTVQNTTYKAELLKGLAWNQFYNLKVDSAFYKADSIFRKVSRRFPKEIEGPWFRGINLMEGGRPFRGIRLFDSLIVRRNIENSAFWFDYARHTFLAFMPNRGRFQPCFKFFETEDECALNGLDSGGQEIPRMVKWKVVSSAENREKTPDFLYQLNFSLPIKWESSALNPNQTTYMATLNNPRMMPKIISGNIFTHEGISRTESDFFISFDFNDTLRTLQDYVDERIRGKYDSISIRDEFQKYHAFSLKCFRKSSFKNHYGDFAWVIAFDRYYYGNQKFGFEPDWRFPCPKIRYLIVLVSCRNDKDKVEKEFMPLINDFVVI